MAAAQELVMKQGAAANIFLTTDDGGVIDKVRPHGSLSGHNIATLPSTLLRLPQTCGLAHCNIVSHLGICETFVSVRRVRRACDES
jgi:hypothetical protein